MAQRRAALRAREPRRLAELNEHLFVCVSSLEARLPTRSSERTSEQIRPSRGSLLLLCEENADCDRGVMESVFWESPCLVHLGMSGDKLSRRFAGTSSTSYQAGALQGTLLDEGRSASGLQTHPQPVRAHPDARASARADWKARWWAVARQMANLWTPRDAPRANCSRPGVR